MPVQCQCNAFAMPVQCRSSQNQPDDNCPGPPPTSACGASLGVHASNPMFKHLYVVLEDGGIDLKQFFLQQTGPLHIDQIKHISRQICAAVAYLHSCRVVHRDLKPANILIDPQTFHVRIADFGLSRSVELPADAAPPTPPTPPTPPSHLGIRKSTSEANFFARMCSSSEFRTVAGEDGPHACVQMGVEHMTLGNDFQTRGAGAMSASPRTRAGGRATCDV